MYSNITASGAATVYAGPANKVIITINGSLTGTIIVTDGPTTVATITNPTTGMRYEYWDFQTSVIVNPSGTTDITVNVDLSRRGLSK